MPKRVGTDTVIMEHALTIVGFAGVAPGSAHACVDVAANAHGGPFMRRVRSKCEDSGVVEL